MATLTALLGIDLGTSAVKAAVTDPAGAPLGSASEAYPVDSPRPGWAQTEPEAWFAATRRAVRAALAAATATAAAGGDRIELAGAGLSGQMHGVVLTADDGSAVRAALLHADTRASGALTRYRRLDATARRRLANPLSPNMAGPMLLWLAEHEPNSLARARWALQPKDWVRARLTGSVAAEPSDASATLLYDVGADTWDVATCRALGLDPALLPPLLAWSGALAGTTTEAAGGRAGLPAGVPVAAGGGDTAVAALGAGLVSPGTVQLTVGSGGQVVTPLAVLPATGPGDADADADAPAGTHRYRAALPHGWYVMGAVLSAGLALDWVRRTLRADWAEVYAAAAGPVRADDPFFLPHLAGERTPYLDPDLRGAWVGLRLHDDRAALLRAALEGVAFALRAAFDALPPVPAPGQGHRRDDAVRLAGGGTADPAWRGMLADVLGRPVRPLERTDVSARGAALLGGVVAGVVTVDDLGGRLAPALGPVVEPDPARAVRLAERYERFGVLVERLREHG